MARVGQGRVRDTRWLVSCDGSQRSGKLNTIYCVDQDFSRCKSRLWTAVPGWGVTDLSTGGVDFEPVWKVIEQPGEWLPARI
jgi:hypothetical protein